nr:efflux RND transporter periplasmic adaptor subunit [Leeia oryzae]
MQALKSLLSVLRRHLGKAILALVGVVLLAVFVPRLLNGPVVPVEQVVQRDFVQTVVASGRVETPHRVAVGVQMTGKVRQVLAEEGQQVKAGAPLLVLDQDELAATLRQSEEAVRQAALHVRQVHELQRPVAEQALKQAEANRDAARQNLTRQRDLFARHFVSQAALDEAQRAADVAEAQVNTARQQLGASSPTGSDTALAEAALAQANANAAIARARLQYATVRAPVDGMIIARQVEPGDTVQSGKELLTLSPTGETQLVVQIDEKNLQLLHQGQSALASADAYASQQFPARLVFINPAVDAQRGSVEMKLVVPTPPAYLKQDMTVSVDIEVARRSRAVLVSVDAIHDADSAAPWVLKVTHNRAHRQPVRLGLRSHGFCEVLQGLQADDLVVPLSEAIVTDGMRIRPQARRAAS